MSCLRVYRIICAFVCVSPAIKNKALDCRRRLKSECPTMSPPCLPSPMLDAKTSAQPEWPSGEGAGKGESSRKQISQKRSQHWRRRWQGEASKTKATHKHGCQEKPFTKNPGVGILTGTLISISAYGTRGDRVNALFLIAGDTQTNRQTNRQRSKQKSKQSKKKFPREIFFSWTDRVLSGTVGGN